MTLYDPSSLRRVRDALQLSQHEVEQSGRVTLAVPRVFDDLLGDNGRARVGGIGNLQDRAGIVIGDGKGAAIGPDATHRSADEHDCDRLDGQATKIPAHRYR